MIINDLYNNKKQDVEEGFQDNHPEYGGKDPNKTLFYDRNLGDYQGEPWSDVSDNWSGDKPEAAPSVSKNPTITLRDNLTGKVKEYDINSPEAQEVIANQKQQTINSPTYKAVVDAFKNVKPAPPGNLATITSDNDWQDARLGRYDVNFPDKFRAGQSTITKPSPNFDPQNIVQVEPKPPLVWPPVDKEKSTAADPEKADNSGKDMRWDPVKARMVPVETEPQVKTVPTSQSLSDKEKEIPSSNSTFYTYKSPEQKSAKLSSRAAGTSKDLPSATPKPGSWQELAKLNNITDPRKLQAGTWVNTPDGGSIYVNKGDTLSGIAQKMRGIREGMEGQVVFRGTGDNGGKYEIIRSGDDFMIHANGKHIDSYGSLQRAISVLKNEVPGLKKSMAEGNPAPGQNFTTSQGQQMNWNPTTKSWASTGTAVPSDGFDVVSNVADMRTTDTPNKHNQTYTSTTIQKNPTTGQQKSLSSWSHDDPVTGKNYSGTNYIDPEGNAQTQKNYQESVEESDSGGPVTHRIGLTVTDPNHPMISKRKEPYQKSVRITQNVPDREAAINQAIAHYRRKGYKVHDHHYIGTVDNEPVNELNKNTVASWVRQQPQRIKGDSGLSRTDFKKAKRLVDKSIPSAISKIKDPGYGKQDPRLDEVSLGDYRKKAPLSQAGAKMNKFFGRNDPATVAAADRIIANRERGMARADARIKPHTPPPVDQDKQRRDLADKYPNIDELVAQAEKRRDPYYDRAEGNAYYAGRDAEHNYHRLKQIQRMIRGAELDEMDFGGVGQTTNSDTGDITTSFNQGPISVSQTKTPGGYTKQTDQRFDLGPATMTQKTVGPNIGAGQLAGTTTKTATNNMTGQSQQQVKGVGFGGATGANVGKNYVGSSDDELAQHAASVFKENVDRIRHLAGIKPVR